MSRERQRARAAREAERAGLLERAARSRVRRRVPRARRVPRVRPARPRFGALPRRVRLGLLAGWAALQWLMWQFAAGPRLRLGLAVLTAAAVPLFVVLFRPQRRRPT